MRKYLKLVIFSIFLLSVLFINSEKCSAISVDKIEQYYVTIDVNEKGYMDLYYHFKWKPIEKPMRDVSITLPKGEIINILAYSKNIEGIDINYNNLSPKVTISFEDYVKEENIVEFDFAIVMNKTYKIKNDTIVFSFDPMIFMNTQVEDFIICWNNAESALSSNCEEINNTNQLVWNSNPSRVKALVTYKKKDFKITKNLYLQFFYLFITLIFIIMVGTIFIIILLLPEIIEKWKNKKRKKKID